MQINGENNYNFEMEDLIARTNVIQQDYDTP